MQKIMNAINTVPFTVAGATRFFESYFDTDAWVAATALDAVIGSTDDWRQRHNFLWYVREGSTGEKLVYIPWDFDRLDDPQALTRGVMKGNPFWDVAGTATATACNTPIQTPLQMAAQVSSDPAQIARWEAIYAFLPPDTQIPVTCDRITQLFALGYASAVQEKIRYYLELISVDQIRKWFSTWSAQIAPALAYDPDGPDDAKMISAQNDLISFLESARAMASSQANAPLPTPLNAPFPMAISSGPFGPLSSAQFRSG